jgi:proteasome lid subunit RPN8/RPN11
VEQELRVVVSEEAFDRISARGNENEAVEIGGILVGQVLRDDGGAYVRVDDTIDALHAVEGKTELTLTHGTWAHVNAEMDTRHAGKRIVGWYHTHPGFGVFLSDRDRFIHQSFFNLPFQIALVHDPKARKHGVFVWKDGAVWRLRHHWIGRREITWDEPRTTAVPEKAAAGSEETPAVKSVPRPAPPRDDEFSLSSLPLPVLAVGALALVVLGSLIGWWFFSPSRPVNVDPRREWMSPSGAERVEAAFASLNQEILGLLRTDIGYAAQSRALEEIRSRLAKAVEQLSPAKALKGPAVPPSLAEAEVRAALDAVERLRKDTGRVDRLLADLETVARPRGPGLGVPPGEAARLRAGLAGLYAELAAAATRGGATADAERLLEAAAALDPANRKAYQDRVRAVLTGTGKQTGPAGGAGSPPSIAVPPGGAQKAPAEPGAKPGKPAPAKP